MGNRVCSQIIMFSLLSWWGLLTLSPCFSVGYLPKETVLRDLLQQESFWWAAVLHNLFWCDSFYTGCSPSGTNGSGMHSPQAHKSWKQTCSSVSLSLLWFTGSARSLLQYGLPTVSLPVKLSSCSHCEQNLISISFLFMLRTRNVYGVFFEACVSLASLKED